MYIQCGFGRISRKGGFELCKLFVVALLFSLWSEVHTFKVEWSLVSPYQLSQQNANNWRSLQGGDTRLSPQNANNWYALQGGDTADIDFSKGGQIAFVPAPFVPGYTRYGLYNRALTPREINIYLTKPKHSGGSSSEEHKRGRKRHHDPDRDYSDYKPEYHHNKRHKSSKEELNDEHAEQAEIAGQMADGFNQMIELKKKQLRKHVDLHNKELSRGNAEAAKKEKAIINIYQKQIEYLEGMEQAEEAIMNGEISMYYDDDGAGQKHGKGHGHHDQQKHDAHEPRNHEGGEDRGHPSKDRHGNQDDNEHPDADDQLEDKDDKDKDPDYEPDNGHKVDRRSPFLTSYLSSDTTAEATAEAAVTTPSSYSPSTTEVSATATATSTSANSNSGWFSWFGSSSNDPAYSPYGFLSYLSPSDTSSDNLLSIFNVFSDPSNSSYLSNASTLMRIVMFFMPGTGIVDQVYFTMALSKIMWEAGTMYYEGYGTTEIAVIALAKMVKAAYLSRRDETSIIDQEILIPGEHGEVINIDGMDVPAFLNYVKNMKYPDLTEAQEEKLSADIDNLVTITYPNISPELKTTFCAGLKDSSKFLSLFAVKGDLKVDNVDVNFSEVYIKMHSAYDDSTLEKIKKSILHAIDTIKSKFQ